jgi:hypothetical protein
LGIDAGADLAYYSLRDVAQRLLLLLHVRPGRQRLRYVHGFHALKLD